ncbi:MAG: antitoxin [Rhodocyclaceae bacterium]
MRYSWSYRRLSLPALWRRGSGSRVPAPPGLHVIGALSARIRQQRRRRPQVLGETRPQGLELEENGEQAEGRQAGADYRHARTKDEHGERTLSTPSSPRDAKLFRDNHSQAVRIPMEFELPGDRALIHREGSKLIIEPVTRPTNIVELLAEWRNEAPLGPEEQFPAIEEPGPSPTLTTATRC